MAITYTTAFGVGLDMVLLPQVGRDDGVILANLGLVVRNALRGRLSHHGRFPLHRGLKHIGHGSQSKKPEEEHDLA
ncbi:MAG: hypothetical protein QNK37_24205 [Acidobacteriota bacterium]|nr:hypothetical protein [Acidobacteriota bacterium]